MNWYLAVYLAVLKKYAEFQGRAQRQDYWMFFLINFLISLGLGVIDAIIGTGVLGVLYAFAVLLPSMAVGARRLHDTGRTGWWLLIGLVPLVGLIILIIFFVQDSDPGDNNYGPNPKSPNKAL
jgi:uncharacterized membrane protein YhaH (DUF805 family)